MADFAENFEDLQISQEARVLANLIYDVTERCRDFTYRDQIQSAAMSAMNNIAEGFERKSPRDFGHFLDIAKGSSGEVGSMLYLGEDRKYLESERAEALRFRSRGLSKGIASFRRRL